MTPVLISILSTNPYDDSLSKHISAQLGLDGRQPGEERLEKRGTTWS